MKRLLFFLFVSLGLSSCAVHRSVRLIDQADVERIIRTLSADDMQGRKPFTSGVDKAAKFIEQEFQSIGLQPLSTESSFRQQFEITWIKPEIQAVTINGNAVSMTNVLVWSDRENITWTDSGAKIIYIKPGGDFGEQYEKIIKTEKAALVLVDEQYSDAFKLLKDKSSRGRVAKDERAIIFVLTDEQNVSSYHVNITSLVSGAPLFNVAGMIKGRSRPEEYVIFSGHYDHIGILEAVNGDSIANGADDDASGITAMISLAKYYKKLNNNERTLVFVAFTAEETGGWGSQYFSRKIDPDKVVGMFNIEMIGKKSRFGKNSAFITGYDRSDFGEILQRNLKGTAFTFYPDPYPEEDLFYRSDNASLAVLGVPAHTISTGQIDKDKFYHTVNDEFETLDIVNIYSTIQAIALSSKGIVAGRDTPRRIPKPGK